MSNYTGTPTPTGTPAASTTTGTSQDRANVATENRRAPRWPAVRETKPSIMSTEFWIYLASVAGVLVASYAVGSEDGHDDYFRADKAWLYIVVLTVGYLVSRGLAKSGSTDHPGDDANR
jgi:hypothetical protein